MANLLTTTIDGSITEKIGTDTIPAITSIKPQLGYDAVNQVTDTTYYYNGDIGSTLVNTVYNVASGNIVVAYRNEKTSNLFGFAVVGTLNDLVLDSCSYTASGTGLTITGGNSALYVDAIRAGFTVEGTGIPAGTTITSTGPFVLSAAATQTVSNGTLTIKNSTVGGVTWGNPVQFMTYNALGSAGIAIADLSGSSKVVIAWSQGPDDVSNVNNGGFAKVATISGLTISYGAVSTFEASTYGLQGVSRGILKGMVSDTTNNRVILCWGGHGPTYNAAVNRQGWASVGTVSGTTLTWHTPVVFEPDDNASSSSGMITYFSAAWDTTLQRLVIVWEDQDGVVASNLGNAAVVGTVDGSHNITFGSVSRNPVYNGDGDQNAIAYNASSGKMVWAYRKYVSGGGFEFGFVRVGTVSGTGATGTVTWGAESSFPLVNDSLITDSGYGNTTKNKLYDMRIIDHADAQKVLITYLISPGYISGHIRGVSGKVSGTTISLSAEAVLNTDNPNGSLGSTTTDTGLAYDTVKKKIIVVTNSNQVGSPHAIKGKGTEVNFDGTNLTVDLATGNFFEVDLETTNNISAITTSNPAAAHISTFILKLTQGYTPRQIEFSELSAFKWIGGTAPTLSTGNDKIDILSFTTYDNGTTWHGSVVGQNNPDATTPSNLFGERGVLGGGTSSGDKIEYITISTLGDGTTFGNLTVAREGSAATSNGSRGVWAGGANSSAVIQDTIDYITIATTGNATDFGNLTASGRGFLNAGTSNGSRGVFGGGSSTGNGLTKVNIIDYITIATTGNATDFGDLTLAKMQVAATSDGVRGVFGGGLNQSVASLNTLDYITIATTGNATDFGDLTVINDNMGACSDGSRGVWAGGGSLTLIHSVTISTTSNAVTFGNLIDQKKRLGATSNGSRGVFLGGVSTTPSAISSTIEYITISTPSTASRFGDLTAGGSQFSATSGN